MPQQDPNATPTPRQVAWAEQENARRQRAFQAAHTAWLQDRNELASMLNSAETYEGSSTSDTVVLKRGERLLYELAYVSLVEVQRAPGHYTSGYSGFSFRIAKG